MSPHFLSPLIIRLAGNEDRHKILDEFKFGPGQTFHCGVISPWGFSLNLNGENGVSSFLIYRNDLVF